MKSRVTLGATFLGEEGGAGGPHVKYLVGKTALGNALVAGFVATYIATVSGIWFYGVKLPVYNFPNLNGYILLGTGYGFANPEQTFIVGAIAQMVQGVLFALIFAVVVHPMLGRMFNSLAPLTPVVNLWKGVIFGGILWIISATLWVPLLIGPLLAGAGVGVGPFLTTFSVYGFQANLTDLFWHMIYGVNLGLLFSPMLASRMGGSTSMPSSMAAGGS
ncbi:MAG: hypothetical protein L3J97_04580 [Thermoplasmata archaeon]|nr:hypothetical protein [Thermoplasmata archaeon]